MRVLGVIVMAPWTTVALAACVCGIHEWAYPPFTDEQLRNFVDTWEPSMWFTMFALVAMGLVFVISLPVAIAVKRQPTRAVAIGTTLLAVAGALLFYRNHAELTHRVTELTGQTFGGFNGLGIF
jgi:uncharacterized integral membrane protein